MPRNVTAALAEYQDALLAMRLSRHELSLARARVDDAQKHVEEVAGVVREAQVRADKALQELNYLMEASPRLG